nr:unnamed protein product [Callosobruchus analis]
MTLSVKNAWKHEERRQKELNLENEHTNGQGKLICSRKMKHPCKNNCRNKCYEKISEQMRLKVFKNFWKLGNDTRQWDFIARCVQQVQKKQVINKNDSRRIVI